jgi:hypothetical protein
MLKRSWPTDQRGVAADGVALTLMDYVRKSMMSLSLVLVVLVSESYYHFSQII